MILLSPHNLDQFYWGHDLTPFLWPLILSPQFLLHFSVDVIRLPGYCCYHMTLIIFYWGHDLTHNARIMALYRSGQILWSQLLQFSTDFYQTLRLLSSLHDLDHIISGPWLDPFSRVTALHKSCEILWSKLVFLF